MEKSLLAPFPRQSSIAKANLPTLSCMMSLLGAYTFLYNAWHAIKNEKRLVTIAISNMLDTFCNS